MQLSRFTVNLILWALVLTLYTGLHSPAMAGLSVTPSVVSLAGLPGEKLEAVIEVFATGNQEHQLRVYPGDWDRTEGGQTRFLPAGSLPRSCAPWAVVLPGDSRAGPDKPLRVIMRFHIPRESRGLYWTMLFVENRPPAPPPEGAGIRVTERFGIKIYITAGPGESALWNLSLNESPVWERGLKAPGVKARLDNQGLTKLVCSVRAELRKPDVREPIGSDTVECRLLPGGARDLFLPFVPSPLPGSYDLFVTGVCGKNTRQEKAKMEIRPGDLL